MTNKSKNQKHMKDVCWPLLKGIQSGLSTESMSITAELNSVYQVSTNLLVSFGELPRKI